MLHVHTYGMYQGKVKSASNFEEQAAHPYALTVLRQNLDMQSAGRTGYGIRLRWSKEIGHTAGYAEAYWQQTLYANSEQHRWFGLSIGVWL